MTDILATLLDASIRSAALAAVVAGVIALARVRVGAVRHAMWTAALGAMLAMPILPLVVPGFGVRLPVLPTRPAQTAAPVVSVVDSPAPAFIAASASVTIAAPIVPEPRSQPEVSVPLAPSEPAWPGIVLAVYALGVALMLAALIPGVHRIGRLRRSSRSLDLPGVSGPVAVSSAVASPVTVGVWRPMVLLPESWSRWSSAELAAVLAHEQAHVRRRDSLVLFVAHLNRAIFWFHPVAWWLVPGLAASAEHACDEAGVRAIGEERRYAELLLEMAKAVHRRHGRVVWSAVGIDGSGLLDRRISHVLSRPRGLSTTAKLGLAVSCAAAIFVVAACRQHASAPPLLEDPTVAQDLARVKATRELREAARALTLDQVAGLEADVARDPENLAARDTLIMFYGSDPKSTDPEAAHAAVRRHALWFVEHHPENDLARRGSLNPKSDAAGYEQAKKFWLAHVGRSDVSAAILGNAASFFAPSDVALAERLLLRAYSMEGPAQSPRRSIYDRATWSEQLGSFYVRALRAGQDNVIQARRKLDASTDPELLFVAGRNLTHLGSDPRSPGGWAELGKSYLARAAALDPAGNAAELLRHNERGDRNAGARQKLTARQAALVGGDVERRYTARRMAEGDWQLLETTEYEATKSLSDAERLAILPTLAAGAYLSAERADYTERDAARAKAGWDRSVRYAQDMLALAARLEDDEHAADAVFEGNVVLATNALREGRLRRSLSYLKAAEQVARVSPAFEYSLKLDQRLAGYLLKAGERESVAAFLERSAEIGARKRADTIKDVVSIRAGRMPHFYQRMLAGM